MPSKFFSGLAKLVGTGEAGVSRHSYRETVTNALRDFKETGLKDLGPKKVVVVDPEKTRSDS